MLCCGTAGGRNFGICLRVCGKGCTSACHDVVLVLCVSRELKSKLALIMSSSSIDTKRAVVTNKVCDIMLLIVLCSALLTVVLCDALSYSVSHLSN